MSSSMLNSRKYILIPIRHDNSTRIIKFVNVVTNVVNTLTQLVYTSDLEAEAGLSSSTRTLSPQLREQWLQYMQDRRLLRGNLIIFKEWLASKAVIHENLLAQTNSSFDRNKNFKAVINRRRVPLLQKVKSQADSRILNVYSKTDNTPFGLVKSSN